MTIRELVKKLSAELNQDAVVCVVDDLNGCKKQSVVGTTSDGNFYQLHI